MLTILCENKPDYARKQKITKAYKARIDTRIKVVDECDTAFYVHVCYGRSVYAVDSDMRIRVGINGGTVAMASYFYSISLEYVFFDTLGILSRVEVQAIDVGTDIVPVGQVIDYVQVVYSA